MSCSFSFYLDSQHASSPSLSPHLSIVSLCFGRLRLGRFASPVFCFARLLLRPSLIRPSSSRSSSPRLSSPHPFSLRPSSPQPFSLCPSHHGRPVLASPVA